MRRTSALAASSVLIAAGLASSGPGGVGWEDVSARSGVELILYNAETPKKHQIETMAGGVAILDFDGDGLEDLYFANGAPQPDLRKTEAKWHNRLYRNLGGLRFEDVTAKAEVSGNGYHFGVAAADYDNDGHTDLFVAGIPDSILYRNRGDGSFENVTKTASAHNRQPWPVAAGWFDADNDGDLDLFVVNYVHWNPETEPFCGDPKGSYRTYCHPKYYTGLPNTLLRNNGDGTFTDVSEQAGILAQVGKGMGVAFADYDSDGDMDLVVTNDTVPNFLFRNEGGLRFRQVGLEAGIAFNDDGRALSSMGCDFRDIDNDGRPDIFITALANETYPLYRNTGKGLFLDITYPTLLGKLTMPLSGWSAGIYDLDNDGLKDIWTANGDVQTNTEVFSSLSSRMKNTMFRQRQDKQFEVIRMPGPEAWYRGGAFADLDGDGAIDVVSTRLNEAAVVLRNRAVGGWVGFRLTGTASNRDAIGARVRIRTETGEQWNHVSTSVGYGSSSSKAVHFGLGSDGKVLEAEILWPSGRHQLLANPEPGRYHSVTEPAQP